MRHSGAGASFVIGVGAGATEGVFDGAGVLVPSTLAVYGWPHCAPREHILLNGRECER